MNLRLGFFRIWLVLSALYVLTIGAFFFHDVMDEFGRSFERSSWAKFDLLLPVSCREVRGRDGEDYNSEKGPWTKYQSEPLCWYKETKFRALYPEYNDFSGVQLSQRLYLKAGLNIGPAPKPWHRLFVASSVAFGPPLAFLILGAAFGWAFAGFAKAPRKAE
jgi:hypothetical protein